MEYYGKNVRHYRGIGFFAFFLVLVPIVTFVFIYNIVDYYDDSPQNVLINFSLFVAAFVGFGCNVISAFRGLIEDLMRSWFERIKDFFEESRISVKDAFKSYFTSFYNEGGIILLIYFLWTIALIVTGVISFINVYNWYLSYEHSL